MYASIARRRRPSIASRGRLLLIDGLGLVRDQGVTRSPSPLRYSKPPKFRCQFGSSLSTYG